MNPIINWEQWPNHVSWSVIVGLILFSLLAGFIGKKLLENMDSPFLTKKKEKPKKTDYHFPVKLSKGDK